MPRPSLTGVFIGVGVLGLAATLVLGAMMWLEQRRADAVTDATRAGEAYLEQMREFWPDAVERVDAAARGGDMVHLTEVVDEVVQDAPELPEASEHAQENSYPYRTADELRADTVGALDALDDRLGEAQAAEQFVTHAREALQSPQDLLAEASGLDANVIRSSVVGVIRDAANAAQDLDLGDIADEDDYNAAYAEALDALTQATDLAVQQGEQMADRLETGGAVGSFDYGEQRGRAVRAVDDFETAYRAMVGSALGEILDPSRADL